jgi:dUTP pyrophosphatase
MIPIKIINSSKNDSPALATLGSAGADLRANLNDEVVLKPMERKLIPTGLKMEIPTGYEVQIRPRSGLAFKHGITVLNSPGTIDSDYRGDVGVLLINLSNENFIIQNGDRIAQMIVAKHEVPNFIENSNLNDSHRGSGGFGSTGEK